MSAAQPTSTNPASLRSPQMAQRRLQFLQRDQERLLKERDRAAADHERLNEYLTIADAVDEALDKLSEDMFGQIVRVLEDKLTLALQEVLEQPIVLKAERSYKRGSATISFHVEREGHREDIMRGQGGEAAYFCDKPLEGMLRDARINQIDANASEDSLGANSSSRGLQSRQQIADGAGHRVQE